jgi:hypothetical protein
MTRLWAFGYVLGLKRLQSGALTQRQSAEGVWNDLLSVFEPPVHMPPCAILHLCMLSILCLHVPALWSKHVNQRACVTQLEKTSLYFAVLQSLVLGVGGDGSTMGYTLAALCLGWYVWQSLHQNRGEWLSAPKQMKQMLVLYFVGCVPAMWMWSPKEEPQRLVLLLLICDVSLVCSECVLQVYVRLGEMCVATTSP